MPAMTHESGMSYEERNSLDPEAYHFTAEIPKGGDNFNQLYSKFIGVHAVDAAEYYVDQHVKTGNPLWAIPGSLALLATPENAGKTGLVLGAASVASSFMIAHRAAGVLGVAEEGALITAETASGMPLVRRWDFAPDPNNNLLRQELDRFYDPVAKDYIYRRSPELGPHSTISELLDTGHIPGTQGVILNDRSVRFGDLHSLSTKDGRAIEFSLAREKIDGSNRFVLYSGGQYTSPFSRSGRTIAHVHPNEIANQQYPSLSDMKLLNKWFFRQVEANPTFKAPPHRVIWGSGNNQNTIVYPGFGKE
jgi:hypothetical protein